MTALRYHEFGGPEVLRIDDDVPVPEPGPGQALIRVSGAGINPADGAARAGHLQAMYPFGFPRVEGWEFSGTIERLGDGVDGYAVGDDVYGMAMDGACADYILADPKDFAKAPPTMDLPDAGGVPLAGLTAWQGLFDHGGLKAGERVLILNGTGGVGTFAVQLARWAGAEVLATGSAKRLHSLRELGADRPIDYRAEDVPSVAGECDLVLDLAGGDSAKAALACVRPGGRFFTAVPPGPGGVAQAYFMRPSSEQLDRLSALIADLKVRPVIDAVVPLIRAIEAQREVGEGHTYGKMVIDVRR